MKINVTNANSHIRPSTKQLLQRMLNPAFGIIQEIGFLNSSYNTPSLLVAGGVLSGVHVLRDREDPGRTAYHIGGGGVYLEEPMIKTLAESVERYAQLLSEFANYYTLKYASYNELLGLGEKVIAFDKFTYFSEEQLARPRFAFQPVTQENKLSWVQLTNVADSEKFWVPAQLVFFGYEVKLQEGEPWFGAGVSTGTATHVTYAKAKRNALLELIQLDAAMGHWYTDYPAYEIEFDHRLRFFEKTLQRLNVPRSINIKYYLINSPDLKGFSTAAVLYNSKDRLPKVAIGLGSDTTLERALYKAFIEGVGTLGLSRLEIFKNRYSEEGEQTDIDPNYIYDLDSNCQYYGEGYNFDLIEQRFLNSKKVKASALPDDMPDCPETQVEMLVNSFLDSGKQLFETSIQLPEINELGFHVCRTWSPDILALCLPSFVPTRHKRFNAYGGVVREDPHPYP